jgi:hypothetical protein
VIDRGAALDLFTLHVFEKKLFEQLINERRIDARNASRSQSPAIQQNVFANHLNAGVVNAALSRAQGLEPLRSLLRPGLAVFMKHPVQSTNNNANANEIAVFATCAPPVECRQQDLFGTEDSPVVVSAEGFIHNRTSEFASPTWHVKKSPKLPLLRRLRSV